MFAVGRITEQASATGHPRVELSVTGEQACGVSATPWTFHWAHWTTGFSSSSHRTSSADGSTQTPLHRRRLNRETEIHGCRNTRTVEGMAMKSTKGNQSWPVNIELKMC